MYSGHSFTVSSPYYWFVPGKLNLAKSSRLNFWKYSRMLSTVYNFKLIIQFVFYGFDQITAHDYSLELTNKWLKLEGIHSVK